MQNDSKNKAIKESSGKLQEDINSLPKSKVDILMDILCEKKILTEEERQDILSM